MPVRSQMSSMLARAAGVARASRRFLEAGKRISRSSSRRMQTQPFSAHAFAARIISAVAGFIPFLQNQRQVFMNKFLGTGKVLHLHALGVVKFDGLYPEFGKSSGAANVN